MCRRLIFHFIILLSICPSCKSQSVQSCYIVENSISIYNLKSSVKEITVNFERYYPKDIPLEKKIEYELKNYWSVNQVPLGKDKFDRHGFLKEKYSRYQDEISGFPFYDSRNERWEYEFNLKDYSNKIELFGQSEDLYPFPLIHPYEVQVNYIFYDDELKAESDESELAKSFVYFTNISGRITDELEKDWKGDIEIRKTYDYDKNDRIVRQDMIFMEEVPEERRLFLDVMLEPSYFILSINHTGYYEYEYTDEGKLSMTKLVIDGEILLQEDYFYEGDSWRPYKLDRYVVSKITSGYQYSDYSTEWYNEFGDITKAENYDKEKHLIRTQYYDYEYDAQNNWTVCKMYLEGQPERTEKPTIIANRDIEYYKD